MGDEPKSPPMSPVSLNLPTIREADYAESDAPAKRKAAKSVSLQLPTDEDFVDDQFVSDSPVHKNSSKFEKNPSKGAPSQRRQSRIQRLRSGTTTAGKSIRRSIRQFSVYAGRIAKPANAYIRWNLLFTFLIFFTFSTCIWVPAIPGLADFSLEIVTIICIILHLLWLIAVINNIRYWWKIRSFWNNKIDWSKYPNPTNLKVKHLVGLCVYKEPLELLMDTIDSITSQPNCKQKISILIGMEEGTPDKDLKKAQLHKKYDPLCERFIVTFHPKGLRGDIPGKCSNFNYASRMAVKQLRADKGYPLDEEGQNVELLVTTGDCDSVFGERYFDALEEDYWKLTPKQRETTVWQSPLFYCINLDKSPFFVRVTGLLRAFFMMGYLIPWNINTMSIFSLTLKLFEEGEYTHPGYQMDDIIALIRWSLAVRRKCVIRPIPVATLSGPTAGKNYIDEWYEWARQIRRWTIGAAEVFHYFAIKASRLPILVSLSFASKFIFYYGFVLCAASIYTTIAPFVTPAMLTRTGHHVWGLVIPNEKAFTWIMLGFLGLQYFWFLTVFVASYACQPYFPNGIKDETGIIRNIFHYIMALPTIIMYCLVELVAFLEVTVRGKSVCSHNASKKDNLVAPVADKAPDRMEV
ncbi:unnamed protein product, partial [Mesorhabditis belari]|uniref:Glycosyltransferase 2-like domain-containing protein n=1 Tax=Mesorhabditis belari TaxID=2138241 RepID=A0AAF3FP36_9BILA